MIFFELTIQERRVLLKPKLQDTAMTSYHCIHSGFTQKSSLPWIPAVLQVYVSVCSSWSTTKPSQNNTKPSKTIIHPKLVFSPFKTRCYISHGVCLHGLGHVCPYLHTYNANYFFFFLQYTYLTNLRYLKLNIQHPILSSTLVLTRDFFFQADTGGIYMEQ